MSMRSMTNTFEGWTFYESTFDQETGITVRTEEVRGPRDRYATYFCDLHPDGHVDAYFPERRPGGDASDPKVQAAVAAWGSRAQAWREANPTRQERWSDRYGWNRDMAFSPVPETIDVKITNACGFGCTYCYMDSVPDAPHADISLIEAIFDGLDDAPYQMALGGGEPLLHPQLAEILQLIRSRGTVPNLTTASKPRAASIAAINAHAGGVALTYHPHMGLDRFVAVFKEWRAALLPRVQLNVHVVAGKGAAKNMQDLIAAFETDPQLDPAHLWIVLLAYYGDVGRSSYTGYMPKSEYLTDFPDAIRTAQAAGARVAFAEGLLPFVLSRPELNLDSTYGTPQEGRFSCYVDDKGGVSHRSEEHI